MTTKPNTGGAAFPVPAQDMQSTGMTLRDYFAAKAMQSCYAEFMRGIAAEEYGCPPDWQIGVAIDAYAMADAMLKAREVQS